MGLIGCSGTASSVEAQGVAVTISPTETQVPRLGTASFTSAVTGAALTTVDWTVSEPDGGTVDSTGHYVAPASTGIFHVVVTSQADPTKSGIAQVTVSDLSPPDDRDLPADRRTLWQPGVTYNGGIPTNQVKYGATLTPASGTGATKDRAQIQSAINAAGAAAAGDGVARYVQLGTGTFLAMDLEITSSKVVVRGTVDANGNLLTKIQGNGTDNIFYIWKGWPTFSPARNLAANAAKGATQITLASGGGATFAVGDIIGIDQLDDASYLFYGGEQWFKRPDFGPASAGPRSMGQMNEVIGKAGDTLTLAAPLHRDFSTAFTAQAWKTTSGIVKWSGIEDLYVTGGSGDMIQMLDTAYCWVRHVESDGSTVSGTFARQGTSTLTGNGLVGSHFEFWRSFRSEFRDTYAHDATDIVQGGGAYGIQIMAYSSDCLVENNIIRNMNKPFACRVSGGGNVVGYNYVDDAWTNADERKQEQAIDFGHSSFPHDELYEGNWVSQIGADNVWGNSGWNVCLRNWATGIQARTATMEKKTDCYEVAAVNIQSRSHHNSFLGNVIGMPGQGQVYETHSPSMYNKWNLWLIGNGTGGGDGGYSNDSFDAYPWTPVYEGFPSAGYTLIRVGNWDYARNQIDAAPAAPLPSSLYLVGKPAFFGASPWPWVTPEGASKTATLPAKARYDAGTPMRP